MEIGISGMTKLAGFFYSMKSEQRVQITSTCT